MAKKTSRRTLSVELVVRRGALRRFHKLKRETAALPVTVSWDRRLGERRTVAGQSRTDGRKAERRQMPPFTWDLSDFVIVAAPPQTRKRKPRME